MYNQVAIAMSILLGRQTIEETWVNEYILTRDVQRYDTNSLPFVCALTHVISQMPSEAALVELQRGDTFPKIIMKIGGIEQYWEVNDDGLLCHQLLVDGCI